MRPKTNRLFTVYCLLLTEIGGEGGIRTHGDRKATTLFESAPINHSGTSPNFVIGNRYSVFGKLITDNRLLITQFLKELLQQIGRFIGLYATCHRYAMVKTRLS